MSRLFKTPLFYFLAFGFFMFYWPFFGFPLTDGDVAHWVGWARTLSIHHNFLRALTDQTHGPLLAWMTAIPLRISPQSFVLYNWFNGACGMIGIFWVYYFSKRFWQDLKLAAVTTFFFSTCLVTVYLSRTPMYDWPAAIFYFGFCGHYFLFAKEGRRSDLFLAVLAVGLSSLSRFSIGIGLSLITMLTIQLTFRKPISIVIRDGLLVALSACFMNAPWVIAQTMTYGHSFSDVFFNDNVGRFIKDQPHDTAHRDFYTFTLTALVAMLPYTFLLIAGLFQPRRLKLLWKSPELRMLIMAAIPCLMIFSLSGHTKLARYIAYMYPPLSMLLGYSYATWDVQDPRFQKWTKFMFVTVFVLIGLGLTWAFFLFRAEANSSPLFIWGSVAFLVSLLAAGFATTTTFRHRFLKRPSFFLLPFFVIYGSYFSLTAYLFPRAPFLSSVQQLILSTINSAH